MLKDRNFHTVDVVGLIVAIAIVIFIATCNIKQMSKQDRMIKTYSGKYVDVFDPTPDMIDINDIARGLSHMPRFAGQTAWFYSVAEHSMSVAQYVIVTHPEWALEALLHDAAEAYIMDLPSPIKHSIQQYVNVEKALQPVILSALGANVYYPDSEVGLAIKQADRMNMNWEMSWKNGNMTQPPYRDPATVRELFLQYYNKLKDARQRDIQKATQGSGEGSKELFRC